MKISYKLEKLLAAVASAIGLSVSIYVIVLAVGGLPVALGLAVSAPLVVLAIAFVGMILESVSDLFD